MVAGRIILAVERILGVERTLGVERILEAPRGAVAVAEYREGLTVLLELRRDAEISFHAPMSAPVNEDC